MAYTVNTLSLNGISNYELLNSTQVSGTDKTISFEVNAANTKDPLFFIIDLSAVFVGVKINVLNTKGEIINSTPLSPGTTNIFTATTFGCVENGKMAMEFECIDGNFASDMKISVSAFSHVPVVNH